MVALVVALLAVLPAAASTKPPHRGFHVIFPRQVVQRDRQHSCAVGAPKSVRIAGPKAVADAARKAVR